MTIEVTKEMMDGFHKGQKEKYQAVVDLEDQLRKARERDKPPTSWFLCPKFVGKQNENHCCRCDYLRYWHVLWEKAWDEVTAS